MDLASYMNISLKPIIDSTDKGKEREEFQNSAKSQIER
jgi:hypothetical protein